MTNYNDNPQIPSIRSDAYLPDSLIAGELKLVTKGDIVLKSGAAFLRGTVLGRIMLGAASSAAKSGGNTGDGTFVLDATTPILAGAIQGVYTLRCLEVVTNGGKFDLRDPKGRSLGNYIIVAGAGGAIAIANQIKGVLTDGATDFAVGDGFDITIAVGSKKFVKAVKTAVDGSADPVCILVDDVDATSADQIAAAYQTGEFNGDKLVIDNSYTLAEVTEALRPLNIHIKSVLNATDPS